MFARIALFVLSWLIISGGYAGGVTVGGSASGINASGGIPIDNIYNTGTGLLAAYNAPMNYQVWRYLDSSLAIPYPPPTHRRNQRIKGRYEEIKIAA